MRTTLSTLDLWEDAAGVTHTIGEVEGEVGWWTTWKDRTSPFASVNGMGRKQQGVLMSLWCYEVYV